MDYKDKARYNSQNNRYSYNSKPQEEELPKDFVINGFNNLREDLILKETKEIARVFANSKKLTTSQMRMFFNEVKALQSKIDGDKCSFDRNYPFILMLKSKADYKYKNGNGTISKSFRDFIYESVDYIKDNKSVETFENFCIVFETIIGYYAGFGKDINK